MIWDLIIADCEKAGYPQEIIDDMRARDAVGRKRYGVALSPNNGRDALLDGYEEALDLVAYLRQAQEEGTDIGQNAVKALALVQSINKLRGSDT